VTATAITLLLLVGAVGKSAQLPLFVWLPDAMAGPTPVSALIHAATMVTAGVYLLTRMSPVIVASYEWAPQIIAWLGAITALFAATAAVAQNDIKKVLAYSTISQLGYLFLAVGVGGYVAGIFHMITHAFFKALLFLAAGSVIHGMHHEQDMRRYGGLAKLLPVTCGVFIVGWLAIAGVPPFSGFWSKDEILAYAWNDNKVLWFIGLVVALLTAFYMSRATFLTFFGRYRYADPTPEEIDQAWDAKVAASAAAADDSQAAVEASRAELEKARAAVVAADEAYAKAEVAVESARPAAAAVTVAQLQDARRVLEGAGDDKDAKKAAQSALRELEKPGKDLEKAQGALTKADGVRAAAATKVGEAESGVEAVLVTAGAARREVDVVRGEAGIHRPSTTAVISLTDAPDVAGVEDHLPHEVAHRREFHPHESPWTMVVPLVILSIGAVFIGFINMPFSDSTKSLEHWLEPSFFGDEAHLSLSGAVQWALVIVAVAAALVGIAVGAVVYLKARGDRARIEQPVLAHAWYIDETYAAVAGGPGYVAFEDTAEFDRVVVDGSVNGVGRGVRWSGSLLRRAQNGYVRSYALGVAVGAVVLVGLILTKASF
jgi:NADH:ubiquinone oxidoreductase subunit 5 (subunit L)/multisubunit Na+/H+ antiporter MnhA subunit